jgi:hypothetical protein
MVLIRGVTSSIHRLLRVGVLFVVLSFCLVGVDEALMIFRYLMSYKILIIIA